MRIDFGDDNSRANHALIRAVGALTVAAEPRGAWIERDGMCLAEGTPVTLEGLPTGPIRLGLGASEHCSVDGGCGGGGAEGRRPRIGAISCVLVRIPYGTLTPADARVEVSREGRQSVVRTLEVAGDATKRSALEPIIPTDAWVEVLDIELRGGADLGSA